MKQPEVSIEELLAKASMRKTPVRRGVLQVLAKSADPMAVPDILEKLPEHTDAVTVYRTLNSFTRKNMVHRVRGEDRTWRYAISGSKHAVPHQHPHFVCRDCGRVECLEKAIISDRFVKTIPVDAGYQVDYAEMLLHGLCARCGK